MNHLSEVAHIVQAAIDGDTQKVRDYAEFLAGKLADDCGKPMCGPCCLLATPRVRVRVLAALLPGGAANRRIRTHAEGSSVSERLGSLFR